MEFRAYQISAVARMLQSLGTYQASYNACEQGLGKTLQTIEALVHLYQGRFLSPRVLIICPLTVQGVWLNELAFYNKEFARHQPVTWLQGSVWKTAQADLPHSPIVVTTYATATKGVDKLVGQFNTLVLDEAHYVKTSTSKRTKAILGKLWPSVQYRICLSGTPFTNSVADCWTIFSRILPQEFGDYDIFVAKFCKVRHTPWGPKIVGIKNADILRTIIRSTFFTRYTKEEVEKELPPKQYQRITLGPEYKTPQTKEEKEADEKYVKMLQEAIIKGNPYVPPPPQNSSERLRKQGLQKASFVAEFTRDLLDQGIPVVLFGYHTAVIAEYIRLLGKYNPALVTTNLSGEKRTQNIAAFQSGSTNLLIAQLISGGIGTTYTRSSTCVLGEVSYDPAQVAQAIDRLHRIGQKDPVNVYYFVVQDSIDEKVTKILLSKSTDFKLILEN